MDSTAYLLKEDPVDPWEILPPDRLRKAIAIRDFMIGPGRLIPDPNVTLEQFSLKLIDAGLPLDRCVTIVSLLHAQSTASRREWDSIKGVSSHAFPHGMAATKGYAGSPAAPAHEHNSWVAFNPHDLPDDAFAVVPELKADGFTYYVCAPVFMVNGMRTMFSFATKAPDGFGRADIALLRAAFPAIAACQEILAGHRILHEVTRTYLGEEPHQRILDGDVRLGEVTRISSAILFADMRDFTSLTADISAEDTTALLNEYFDCIVPAVEQEGGEVLKYIGDGVLAIFRADADGSKASAHALAAARNGLTAVAARNQTGFPKFEVGIALHFGEVAYGNVGSGTRLDYTVIGRDVNLAARIAGLCGTLKLPLLVSSGIHDRTDGESYSDCGLHQLKGLSDPQQIFGPSE